jgi:hypothetical protein
MSDATSYWLFGGSLVLLLLAVWRARRPYLPGQLPLVPWTAVQYVALVVFILMTAHLVSIWSGHPLIGRRSGF